MKAKYSVSLADLDRRFACQSEQDLFESTFGTELARKGVPVTATNIRKADAAGLSLSWLLSRIGHRKDYGKWGNKFIRRTGQIMRENPDWQYSTAVIKALKEFGYL